MDKSECTICNESFDSDTHRPRVLPCGHGYCTKCIQDCITRCNTTCPVCRAQYTANVATELPVCFLLEEFIQNVTISAPQTTAPIPACTVVMCPKHVGVPLHFFCKSHYVEICHSCAVIDHPPTSCKLTSIADKMNEMKETEMEIFQKGKKGLKDTERDLNKLYQEKDNILTEKERKKQNLEKEVEFILTKIEHINQEINETKKSKEHIKDSIVSCQKKHKTMDSLESNLKAAAGNQAFSQECAKTISEILIIKKWEDELRKEHKLNQQYAKYAQVQRSEIIRSSKIVNEGGRMFIQSLTKELKPVSSAKLLKEAELGLTSASTKVFLELSAPGCRLGRVILNVRGDRSYGRQFVMLALGTEGRSYKKAMFSVINSDNIQLRDYVTETGSHSTLAVFSPLKPSQNETMSRGKLICPSPGNSTFRIMTKDRDQEYAYQFGNVIEGMDIVDRIFSQEFSITDICVSDCGIIINY